MKLHTCAQAPNPRRVHLFLAAKKVEIDTREIDLRAEEHQSEAFRALNRHCTVPVLELDDGTCLSESIAICRYLEDIFPEPALMGTGAVERARIADIEHWIEINGLLAVTEAFRNSAAGLQGRAVTGCRSLTQIPALAERGRTRYDWFLEDFNDLLRNRRFAAGDQPSVADITALVTVDFAKRGIKTEIPQSLSRIQAWRRSLISQTGLFPELPQP
ncbi:MAG: glutathione S-transferase family protein [Wenzhouxiangellaceae bacterium]